MIHLVFDVVAIFSSIAINHWFRKKYHISHSLNKNDSIYYWYLLILVFGLVIFAFLFGTLNIYLSGYKGIGKSFLGGILGAILCIEVFKKVKGYKASTGLYYVPGICALIIIGRLGCFLSGMDDFTYGIPTQLALGYDFGDGVRRHPVQLYESFSLGLFLIIFLSTFKKHQGLWETKGFYLFIFFYASQRLIWEFFKPYATLFFSLNLFQFLTILLIIWSLYKFTSQSYAQ